MRAVRRHFDAVGVGALLAALLGIGCATSTMAADQGAAEAQYLTLQSAIEHALEHDAEYRAAGFGQRAGAEFEVIGRAALRPSLQVTGNLARNRQDRQIEQANGLPFEDRRYFGSDNLSVRMVQPLYAVGNKGRYLDGMARAELSEVEYAQATQEFKVRVVQRYTELLRASENLRLLEAEGESLMYQTRSADARLERGEATRLEVSLVRTAMERWRAEIVGARGLLAQAQAALYASTGPAPREAAQPVFDARQALPLGAADPERWIDLGIANSPIIAASRSAVELAEAAETRARGERLPRIDAYASYVSSDSDTANTVNQTYDTSSLGLQVSMPLYLGGAGAANLRQARFLRQQAEADLEAEIGSFSLDLRQAHDRVRVLGQQHYALDSAAAAAAESLDAAERGLQAGTEGLAEVLDALRDQRQVMRDLLDTRYAWVTAYAELHALAGVLDDATITRISTALIGTGQTAATGVSSPATENLQPELPRPLGGLKLSSELRKNGAIIGQP